MKLLILELFKYAPLPFSAKNISFLIGSKIIPEIISDLSSYAIDIAKCGKPFKKLNVPSIGSIIHFLSLFFPSIKPVSSLKIEYSDFSNSLIMIPSTRLSEAVTKSPGPFSDTCNFSTSPKSLIKTLEAFKQALCH